MAELVNFQKNMKFWKTQNKRLTRSNPTASGGSGTDNLSSGNSFLSTVYLYIADNQAFTPPPQHTTHCKSAY